MSSAQHRHSNGCLVGLVLIIVLVIGVTLYWTRQVQPTLSDIHALMTQAQASGEARLNAYALCNIGYPDDAIYHACLTREYAGGQP